MNILEGDTKTAKGKGLLTVLQITPIEAMEKQYPNLGKVQKNNGVIAQILWGTNGLNPNCDKAYTQNVFSCGGLGKMSLV